MPAGCVDCDSGKPGPRGIHFNQAGSQSKLTAPSTTKNQRQPMCATSRPPTSVPIAGPPAQPAEMRPLARPRCSALKCFAMILM